MGRLRIFFILVATIIVTLVLAVPQFAAIALKMPIARKIPMIWHRIILFLVGTKVTLTGKVPKERPLLVVSNHASWLDIMVLGSVLPVSFIAKSEVKSMPGVNLLAAFQRTVYVERARRSSTSGQVGSIASRLKQGDNIVLFAEGTTGTGNHVLPFKSALFAAPQKALEGVGDVGAGEEGASEGGAGGLEGIHVLPVAIAYTRLHNLPLGRIHRARITWPGNIPLGPPLIDFLRHGAYEVSVSIGEPFLMTLSSNRKQVARDCEEKVRQLFAGIIKPA